LYATNCQFIDNKQNVREATESENLFQKLQINKKNFKSIHEKKDKSSFKKLVDEVLSSENLEELNKGRKSEDTKAILGYTMSALYSFETDKFFEEVKIFL
jgi:hypothetical protein